MEQQDRASTSFKEMVQRIVNIEAKAGLRSSTMVWHLDAYSSRGHHPSHNTSSKVQTQGSKNLSRPKKTKPKDPKSAPSHDDTAESPKKDDGKDKKKGSEVKGKNILESRKSRFRPLMSTPPMSQRKRRRSVTLVRLRVSTVIRKATLPITAPSQKTSVGFDNLRAID